jgi:hypothetical protein
MSHPTEQIHIKQDVPSSIDPSSSLSNPLHAREENLKHHWGNGSENGQRVEGLLAAADVKRLKELGQECVEKRRLSELWV